MGSHRIATNRNIYTGCCLETEQHHDCLVRDKTSICNTSHRIATNRTSLLMVMMAPSVLQYTPLCVVRMGEPTVTVCGKDGVTYSNTCHAGGNNIRCRGECPC